MTHSTQSSLLLDRLARPFRDLRISVTDRCNFRCTYCMPADVFDENYQFLPKRDLLTFEEITRLARVCVGLGARKLRLTGGEPLVRRDIAQLVGQLAVLDGVEDLAMTTNGVLLPQLVEPLRDAGLSRLTISLDTLDPDIFRRMNGGRAEIESVFAGIEAAERAGFGPLKINTVVQRGVNDHTVVDLARYFKQRGHIVRFIEYMDVGTMNGWRLDEVMPAKAIVQSIHAEMPLDPIDPNYPGEVARRFRYRDGSGEIGVIASVTQPFCGDCTRLRMSPEGELYTCLFGIKGTDMRAPLRAGASDDELAQILRDVWTQRTDRYSELRSSQTSDDQGRKVEMFHIGG